MPATNLNKHMTTAATSVGALAIATLLMAGVAVADSKPSTSKSSSSTTSTTKSSSTTTTAKLLQPTFESKIPVAFHVTFNVSKNPKLKPQDIKGLSNGYAHAVDKVPDGTKIDWEATPEGGDRTAYKKCSGSLVVEGSHTAIVMTEEKCEKRAVQAASQASQNAQITFVNKSGIMKASFSQVNDKMLGKDLESFTLEPGKSKPITVAKDPSGKINLALRIDCETAGKVEVAKGQEDAFWDQQAFSTIQVIDGCHFKTQ
jgi:uncharacterized cupredoxin-like copper-binding protein